VKNGAIVNNKIKDKCVESREEVEEGELVDLDEEMN